MSWPVLVFDIETIPDVPGLRVLRQAGPEVGDRALYDQVLAERKEAGQSDFLPLYLQRVLVISCVYRAADGLQVHSLVDHEPEGRSEEGKVIQTFFKTVDKRVPQLVSWNGGGFDLPVLHHRGLVHGVQAPQYWDQGELDRDFKWNNYIARYHHRHLDLMDVLASYQPRANAPLDAMAKLCGFPGKLGMDGSAVYPAYLEGRRDEIRKYCETDVMNTYLLYCRYQLMRGGFTQDEYDQEVRMVRQTLTHHEESHWQDYVAAWPS